jgi:hypothetical protein
VASDPADVSHASESVVGMEVEDILDGQGSTEQVAPSRMHDTFRLSRRTRCLQKRTDVSEGMYLNNNRRT